jgi:hypothetical protein
MVKKNLRFWQRMMRFPLGIFVLAWGIAGGPWWTLIGLFPLATAAFGYCPVVWVLRR